jgi:hypothetical protein
LTFLVVVAFYIINIVTNIIDWVQGQSSFFIFLYSIMHACIAIPLSLLFMSKGFRCLAGITTELRWYKYGEIFFIVGSSCAFCFGFLCYHGIRFTFNNMRKDGFIEFGLGLIELALLLTSATVRSFCAYSILVTYGPKEEENS